MTALIVFLLFIGFQVAASLLAVLLSVNNVSGGGVTAATHATPAAMCLALFITEALLSIVLWTWYYKLQPRFDKLRQVSAVKSCQPAVSSSTSAATGHQLTDAPSALVTMPTAVLGRKVCFAVLSVTLLAFGLSLLLKPFDMADEGSSDLFRAMLAHPLSLIQLCLVGPLAEELVFRVGIVRSLHRKGLSPWLSAIIAAAAFAVVHGNPAQMVPAFLIGVVLGLFYLRTGNLWLCLSAHIANNVFAVVFLQWPDALSFADNWPVEAVIALGLLHVGLGLLNAWRTLK